MQMEYRNMKNYGTVFTRLDRQCSSKHY